MVDLLTLHGPTWGLVALLGIAVAVGAFVQSGIGFGLAVVAAPFVVLFAPELMPGALLFCGIALPLVQLAQGPRDIDWRLFGWAMGLRLATTPLGVLIVTWWSARGISILIGVLILVTVALAFSRLTLASTPRNAALAGAVSGVAGTAAAIGGPFLAIVLAGERPSRVRATLSTFFLTGTIVSLASLVIGGQLHSDEATAMLVWLPFVLLGYLVAVPLRRKLDPKRLRLAVLWFCVVAGVSVIVRALFLG